MIINIDGEKISRKLDTKLELHLPSIRFDSVSKFQISIRHLHIIFENNDQNRHLHDNDLLCLRTNLVQRSSTNPFQSLLYFSFNAKKHLWQNILITDATFFDLALFEMENASFEIVQVYNDQPLIVDKIFIQLEIKQGLTHGWV